MIGNGQVTLLQVEKALEDLGGQAEWLKILDQLTKNRNGDYSHYRDKHNYETTAFQVIQRHCVGYEKYGGTTRFERVKGTFRLMDKRTPTAIDIEDPSSPGRVKQETYRILRDTMLARRVKETHQYQCQICGRTLKLADNRPYAEAHHILPLGKPHNGPDVRGNILCVCPNDHVLLDYGVIKLDGTHLEKIEKEYIDYHNEHIYGKTLV